MLIDSEVGSVFPDLKLTKDSKSAAKWATTAGGMYAAAGVGTGIAGKGFHLGLIDDPISEQDAFSDTALKSVREWYGPGLYTRRQPERNAIVLTMTRWNAADLAGYLLSLKQIDPDADDWDVLSVPAILDDEHAEMLNEIAEDPQYRDLLEDPEGNCPYPMRYKAGDSFAPRRCGLKGR